MTRYALFLRGINVGGVRVPMPQLRKVLADIGCQDVKTWLATGNVALDDRRGPAELKTAAETALTDAFAYEAYVVVRPASELAGLVAAWPFVADANFHRYVVFGGGVAFDDAQSALARTSADSEGAQSSTGTTNTTGEAVVLSGPDLLWNCPKGTSTTSPIAKALSQSWLKPLVTTRYLNTIEKML